MKQEAEASEIRGARRCICKEGIVMAAFIYYKKIRERDFKNQCFSWVKRERKERGKEYEQT